MEGQNQNGQQDVSPRAPSVDPQGHYRLERRAGPARGPSHYWHSRSSAHWPCTAPTTVGRSITAAVLAAATGLILVGCSPTVPDPASTTQPSTTQADDTVIRPLPSPVAEQAVDAMYESVSYVTDLYLGSGERVSTSEMAELKAAMLIATTAAAAVTAHIKSDEFNTGQLAALSIMGSSGADIADDMSSRL